MEHDGKVVGESLDLLLLIDEWFGDKGPRIVPENPALAAEASALVAACGDLMMAGYSSLSQLYQTGGEAEVEAAMGSHLDSLEASLTKRQGDGPFFLGSFSYQSEVRVYLTISATLTSPRAAPTCSAGLRQQQACRHTQTHAWREMPSLLPTNRCWITSTLKEQGWQVQHQLPSQLQLLEHRYRTFHRSMDLHRI
ncbi:unnamed protein product [Closterium sp. NIES-53]